MFPRLVELGTLHFVAKNPRLKHYMDVVWNSIKKIDDFSIKAIPIEDNHLENNLAFSASILQHFKETNL
jgi:hypothetical protein